MKKKAITVAFLCFVIGFLSLYTVLSVRDLQREANQRLEQFQPKSTPSFQFGYPPAPLSALPKMPSPKPPAALTPKPQFQSPFTDEHHFVVCAPTDVCALRQVKVI